MMKGQKRSEIILYVVLWALLFAAPVISLYLDSWHVTSTLMGETVAQQSVEAPGVANSAKDWMGVFSAWSLLGMFCVVFFVHNFLIAPLLVYRNKKWQYAGFTAVLVVAFMAYQLWGRPHRPVPGERMKPGMEKMKPGMEKMEPGMESMEPRPEKHPAPPAKPQGDDKGEPRKMEEMHEPPRAFGGQDSVAFIIMALLLGLNVGTKYFFKSLDDKKRIKELERENLNRQLEYLKYQINPHFFMNTLNNIHALVDIDPEQAKYTIEVLSKLMRYVLYEGNKTMAPLQKELDFIGHYVDLMRIRYTDRVSITVSMPSTVPDVMVPSLLFTTFVENAFKHGVSYQRKSFIEVSVGVDETAGEIAFCCNNSVKPEAEDKQHGGGVGLRNARKRLQLIYGDDYKLDIHSSDEDYRLLLRLPVKTREP